LHSSAADGVHGADGLDEVGVVDLVAGPFVLDALADLRDDFCFEAGLSQEGLDVGLFEAEQAVAEFAVGGQAEAVAVAAEW